MSAYFKARAMPLLLVGSSAELKAEPSAALPLGMLARFHTADSGVVAGTMARYDPAENASGDDATVWTPDDAGATGRWVIAAAEDTSGTLVLRKADGTIDGAGGLPDFSQPVLHVNVGGSVPAIGLFGISVDFGVGADRRGLFWDAVNATFAAARDTAGNDSTISSYLPLRVAALKVASVENAAGGTASTGLLRMAVADEIRARIGSQYRVAAALAGPVVAFGDSAVATTTVDADTLVQATSRTGSIALRAATTLDVLDNGGSNQALQVDLAAGKVLVKGTLDVLAAGVLTLGGTNATSISASSLRITSLAAPVSGTDAATKAYVDAYLQGLAVKPSVRAATTANITLSGAQTVDGVALVAGNRALVKNQSTASQNGHYLVASGAWTRVAELAAGSSAAGTFVFVEEGTANADSGWVCTSDAGSDVVGTDSLAFTQFSGAGQITAGAGMTKTGNTLDVVAADGTLQVNADSIEATGVFGAKSISQTGATGITAGSLGFLGAKLSNAGGALSIGVGSETQIDLGHGTIATTVTGALTSKYDAVGAADVASLALANTTSSGSTEQRPPTLRQSGYGHDNSGGGAQVACAVERSVRLVTASGNPEVRIYETYARTGGSGGTSSGDWGHYWTTSLPGLGGLGLYFASDTLVLGSGSNGIRGQGGGSPGWKFDGSWNGIFDGGTSSTYVENLASGVTRGTTWGGKGAEYKLANQADVTSTADTVIATYASANGAIYDVVAVFHFWKTSTDYATIVRRAQFYRDGASVTQNGTTDTVGTDKITVGFLGIAADISASGTNIRGVARGLNATTIKTFCSLTVTVYTP